MQYILTSGQMKETEDYTINTLGISSLALMEVASRNAYDYIINNSNGRDNYLIVCGSGNNGADAMCIARFLFTHDKEVYVYFAGNIEKMSPEMKIQYETNQKLGLNFVDYKEITGKYFSVSCIIDGLFGISLNRELQDNYLKAVEFINEYKERRGAKVYSLDIPSGLDASTGKIYGSCVKADVTITNQWLKSGLILNDAPIYTGKIVIKDTDIILKPELKEHILKTHEKEDIAIINKRNPIGHKGTYGKLLIIGGNDNMPGALLMSSIAAKNMGTGMLKCITAHENKETIISRLPDVMIDFFDMTESEFNENISWCDACIIGPGLGQSAEAKAFVLRALSLCTKPLIVDGDAINLISSNENLYNALLERKDKYKTILTPHPSEFARLFKTNTKDKMNQDIDYLKNIAANTGTVIVAKDARTVVTDGKDVYINTYTNTALSTAGSGDILCGIIGALVAVDFSLDIIGRAVYIHSLAGIEASYETGERACSANDILDAIVHL